jgi:Ca-activated chloride channel family protein
MAQEEKMNDRACAWTVAAALALTALLLLSPDALAWNPFMKENGNVKKGNKLVGKEKYADAVKKYNAALGDLSDSAAVHYDKGVGSYKLAVTDPSSKEKGLQDAASSLLTAIDLAGDKETDLKGKAFYNLGNVYFSGERFQEAAEAYRQALKLMPGDKDAAFNLSVAIKKIEEQKRKEEEEKKKQEEEKKQEEQQQKQQEQKQEEKKDDQQCDQGKKEGEQKKEQEKKEQQGQNQSQQQQQQQQQQKEQQQQQQQKEQQQKQQQMQQKEQQGQDQQQQAQQKPVPLTEQQAEAILDALQRGEKNFQLDTLKNLGAGKPKVIKDW